jgi:hypothetical protein
VRGIRSIRLAVALVAALTGGIVLAAPAGAAPSHGYVQGAGAVTDDWGDEGIFSRSDISVGWAVGLWQAVLYADGANESDGTDFDLADIDCQFGPNTERATINWQRTHNVDDDGEAGPVTLGRADNKLSVSSTSTDPTVQYNGDRFDLIFDRLPRGNGRYSFINGDGGRLPANYNSSTC